MFFPILEKVHKQGNDPFILLRVLEKFQYKIIAELKNNYTNLYPNKCPLKVVKVPRSPTLEETKSLEKTQRLVDAIRLKNTVLQNCLPNSRAVKL